MATKNYVPRSSAKKHEFPNGGSLIKLSFRVADLIPWLNEHKNDKDFINLIVAERREPSQYGDTHTVYLDDWQPTPKGQSKHPSPRPSHNEEFGDSSAPPF